MNTLKKSGLAAGLLAMAALALPSHASAQRSGVEIWAVSCGRCHTIQPPNRYSAKDWISIMQHMTVAARLTDAQRDAVLAFLKQGARKVASAPQPQGPVPTAAAAPPLHPAALVQSSGDPEKTFESLCAACHGPKGKGDGPAAIAFNPKPADFTNPELWAGRTDADIGKWITEGVRMMPAFGQQLKPDQIKELASYVRSLSGVPAPKAEKIAS
jgi:mono/diheme cytochrome c family protein